MTNPHPPTAKPRNPLRKTQRRFHLRPSHPILDANLTRQARPQRQRPKHSAGLPSSLQAPHRPSSVLLKAQTATSYLVAQALSTIFPIWSSMEDEN